MVTVIVQARTGSSRLPGKVLMQVGGVSLIGHCVARLKRARRVDEIVIATTDRPSDDALAAEVERGGTRVVRGSEHDVLDRYFQAAAAAEADVIVRVTGDCPLIDPDEVDRVVAFFQAGALDYASNQSRASRSVPRGLDVEVFSRAALARAHAAAKTPGQREHVTPYFYENPEQFRLGITDSDIGHGDVRLTVDTAPDFEVVKRVLDALGPDATTASVLAWLEAHPEVARLNQSIQQRGVDSETERRVKQVAGRVLLARADGGGTIGFGHVARVEALLDAWTELGGEAVLLTGDLAEPFTSRLKAAGVEVVSQPGLGCGADDAEAVRALASERGAVAVVVDGYRFDAPFYAGLQPLPAVVLDDTVRDEVRAAITVHPYPAGASNPYEDPRFGAILMGAEYALLRREFRQAHDDGARARILVTFGGSDPLGVTPRAMRELASHELPVDVVVGPGFSPSLRAEIQAVAEDAPGRFTLHAAPPSLSALARGAAVAVAAAGSTVWELMACGTVPVVVEVADNQQVVASTVTGSGAGLVLGAAAALAGGEMGAAAADLVADPARLQEHKRKGRSLIDGRGVWRVIDALLDVIESPREES